GGVVRQSLVFLPLIVANVAVALATVHTRMTMQRRWRGGVHPPVVDPWLAGGRHYHLNPLSRGPPHPQDRSPPGPRVGRDSPVACDAPVDFVSGILAAAASAITFIGVLWFIGGSLTIHAAETTITVPGFLVIAAIIYAVLASGSMVFIGRRFVAVSEDKNQAEAEYRYALTRLRENGESIALLGGEDEERTGLDAAFRTVRGRWREVLGQWLRTSVVSQTSAVFVPVIPLILCAPKYVDRTMTLGHVMQAASAFVTVQVAFNWVVDNYPRLSDWTASARRVASLLASLALLELPYRP